MNLRLALASTKFIYKRMKHSRIIKKFDTNLDKHFPSKSSLANSGFVSFSLNEFFEDKKFCKDLQESSLRKKIGEESVIADWNLPELFWKRILSSKKLEKLVKDYLGPKARIDDAYLKTIGDGLKSVSEGWHDDNVGYRLKLFIVFDTEGTPAPTLVVPTSRPFIYSFKLIDEVRRIIFKKIDTGSDGKAIAIKYKPGSCVLFDTNIKHRGGYSLEKGVRHCLIVEFIDKDKAEAIKSFSPCGPMQGKGTITIPASKSLIEECGLIDKDILVSEDNKFIYG